MAIDLEAVAKTFASKTTAPDLGATVRRQGRRAGLDSLPRVKTAPPEVAVKDATVDLSLDRLLGQGGMGEVWLARQHSLRRSVALKRPRGDSEEAAGALVLEARVSGGLEHPHIIPVHVLGLDEDGSPVLVMKRIAGTSLRALLEDARHPAWDALVRRHGDRTAAVLDVLMKVADALEFAHSRRVLHRDVKPDNVMVGDFGEVYLLDWGVALELDEPHDDGLVGTPAYLAPELVRAPGQPRALDARTDVYLLGGTLHAALTGRPRHEGDTLEAVLASALSSTPVAYGPGVSPELAEVCNRATACRPEDRFPSAAAFRDELSRVLRQRALRKLAEGIAAGVQPALDGALPAAQRAPTLMAARYALAPVLAEWADNVELRALHHRILATAVTTAVERRALADAEEALAALEAPRPELEAQVAGLRASLEETEALAAYGKAQREARDIAPSFKGLSAVVVLMGLASAYILFALLGGEEPTMEAVLATDVGALGFVAVGAAFFRRSLLANRRSRSTFGVVVLMLAGMSASDGVGFMLGHSTRDAAPASLLMMAFGFGAMALGLDVPRRVRRATGACGALVLALALGAAAWPASSLLLSSLATVIAMVAAVFVLFDMWRERAEAQGRGAG